MTKDIMILDSYDKRILYNMDRAARTPISSIGRTLRKSKQFVDYRIKKLEKEKVLLGYTTVIDHSKLGYTSIRVYLKFHRLTPEKQAEIENELIKDKEVWWLVTLEGVWDVGYAMAVKDLNEFYLYWDKIMQKYRGVIYERSIVIYSHVRQWPKSYLIGKENEEKGTLVGASSLVKHDTTDLQILEAIAKNARFTFVELSKQTKISIPTLMSRIKNLENNGIIQGYKALIDVSKFGYRYYKAYLNLVNTERLFVLESFCKVHPNILNINKTIGGRDFEIEMQAKDFNEFQNIMNSLRETFSDMIDEYEFVIAREEKKMEYFIN